MNGNSSLWRYYRKPRFYGVFVFLSALVETLTDRPRVRLVADPARPEPDVREPGVGYDAAIACRFASSFG